MTMTAVQKATKKLILKSNVVISGPYYEFSKPYGTFVTCQRDKWYVSKKLTKKQQKTEMHKITGTTCLGVIIKPRRRRKYIISQLFPEVALNTLQEAVDYLIENQGKLVFCT